MAKLLFLIVFRDHLLQNMISTLKNWFWNSDRVMNGKYPTRSNRVNQLRKMQISYYVSLFLETNIADSSAIIIYFYCLYLHPGWMYTNRRVANMNDTWLFLESNIVVTSTCRFSCHQNMLLLFIPSSGIDVRELQSSKHERWDHPA